MCSCTGSLLKCVQWLRKDQDLGTHLGSPHDGMGYFYFSIFCCLPGCARERRWECGMWVEPELKSWHSHTGCRYSNCFLLLRLSSYLSCSTMSQIQIQTPCKLFFFLENATYLVWFPGKCRLGYVDPTNNRYSIEILSNFQRSSEMRSWQELTEAKSKKKRDLR